MKETENVKIKPASLGIVELEEVPLSVVYDNDLEFGNVFQFVLDRMRGLNANYMMIRNGMVDMNKNWDVIRIDGSMENLKKQIVVKVGKVACK